MNEAVGRAYLHAGVLVEDDRALWRAGYGVLSKDGKWLAAVSGKNLVVLDLVTKKCADLGPVTIHPDREWDCIKPSWNPWSGDSSTLAFVSEDSVVVASPDGKQKRTLCHLVAHAGLATPSPGGIR